MLKMLPVRGENRDAVLYVGTTSYEGLAQLDILKKCGCQPHHRVLEIGCGALVAGFPIMQYLDHGNYVGLDPNTWLHESSRKILEVDTIVREKQASIYDRKDFRTPQAETFDYILSHSILSHTSSDQVTEFLEAVRAQIVPDGTIVASIRFADGNRFGSPGSPVHGFDFKEWQYPGVSWFTQDDILARTKEVGLSVSIEPDFTRMIMDGNSRSIHDWLLMQPTT